MKTSSLITIALLGFGLGTDAVHASPDGSRQAPALAADSHELVVPTGARQIYITTDKPMYRPGETVWLRAWDVQVRDFLAPEQLTSMTFELVDPRGSVAARKKVRLQAGVATNDFALPPDMAGGAYTLRASSNLGDRGERTISVSTYELPRIKKTLEFARSSYGPGEQVFAELSLNKAAGEPLARARATAVVWLDGAQVARLAVRTDRSGRATVRFRLPARISRGEGMLTVMIDGGGVTESIQRRIPIAVQAVELGLYPEGGDLIAGLPARVYFKASDPFGEPVDITGVVVDDRGTEVTGLRTFERGMGRFSFTPEAGRSYRVRVRSPKNIDKDYPLPAAQERGCTLASGDDYRSQKRDMQMTVTCTEERDVIVTTVLRESLVGRVNALIPARTPTPVTLAAPVARQGAVRVTVFSGDHQPLAERLVYRGLGRHLQVQLQADRPSYAPRDKVELTVQTRDADGKPIAAEVALAVVDDTVLNLADDKSAHILAAMYLAPEMPGQKIREPNFYFSDDPKAPQALDCLLATQGWRRFKWVWKPRQ